MRAGVTVIRRQGLGVGMVWAAVLVAPLPASAEPAVEAPGQEAPPERLAPVAIHTGHGTDRIQVGAAAQLRATLTSDDLGSAPEDVDLSVALQRLRLKTSGHFLDDALEFRLQVNLTPQQAELIDAWASYRFDPRAVLSLGQMKVPFTAYRAGSFSSLVLADWGETSQTDASLLPTESTSRTWTTDARARTQVQLAF